MTKRILHFFSIIMAAFLFFSCTELGARYALLQVALPYSGSARAVDSPNEDEELHFWVIVEQKDTGASESIIKTGKSGDIVSFELLLGEYAVSVRAANSAGDVFWGDTDAVVEKDSVTMVSIYTVLASKSQHFTASPCEEGIKITATVLEGDVSLEKLEEGHTYLDAYNPLTGTVSRLTIKETPSAVGETMEYYFPFCEKDEIIFFSFYTNWMSTGEVFAGIAGGGQKDLLSNIALDLDITVDSEAIVRVNKNPVTGGLSTKYAVLKDLYFAIDLYGIESGSTEYSYEHWCSGDMGNPVYAVQDGKLQPDSLTAFVQNGFDAASVLLYDWFDWARANFDEYKQCFVTVSPRVTFTEWPAQELQLGISQNKSPICAMPHPTVFTTYKNSAAQNEDENQYEDVAIRNISEEEWEQAKTITLSVNATAAEIQALLEETFSTESIVKLVFKADAGLGTGALTAQQTQAVSRATLSYPNTYISVDLSACTGMETIPEEAFYLRADNGDLYTNRKIPAIAKVILPSSIKEIGNCAFMHLSNLTHINLPYELEKVGMCAFDSCRVTDISFPSTLVEIGSCAFQGCDLTSIIIPDSVTEIGDHAFNACTSVTNIHIGEGVSEIKINTFCQNFSLTAVSIPSSVTIIGEGAFSKCTSLSSIEIPQTVTHLGSRVFQGNEALQAIDFKNTNGWYAVQDTQDPYEYDEEIKQKEENSWRECTGGTAVAASALTPQNFTSETGALLNVYLYKVQD